MDCDVEDGMGLRYVVRGWMWCNGQRVWVAARLACAMKPGSPGVNIFTTTSYKSPSAQRHFHYSEAPRIDANVFVIRPCVACDQGKVSRRQEEL